MMARWSDRPPVTFGQTACEKMSLTHMTSNIWIHIGMYVDACGIYTQVYVDLNVVYTDMCLIYTEVYVEAYVINARVILT